MQKNRVSLLRDFHSRRGRVQLPGQLPLAPYESRALQQKDQSNPGIWTCQRFARNIVIICEDIRRRFVQGLGV